MWTGTRTQRKALERGSTILARIPCPVLTGSGPSNHDPLPGPSSHTPGAQGCFRMRPTYLQSPASSALGISLGRFIVAHRLAPPRRRWLFPSGNRGAVCRGLSRFGGTAAAEEACVWSACTSAAESCRAEGICVASGPPRADGLTTRICTSHRDINKSPSVDGILRRCYGTIGRKSGKLSPGPKIPVVYRGLRDLSVGGLLVDQASVPTGAPGLPRQTPTWPPIGPSINPAAHPHRSS